LYPLRLGLVVALIAAVSQGTRAEARTELAPRRQDIVAKFSSGMVVFNANGAAGSTTIKSGLVSLSTDNPYCVASPTSPCKYTINRLELAVNDVVVEDVPARNITAFNWVHRAIG
jgi:hypothetical protein